MDNVLSLNFHQEKALVWQSQVISAFGSSRSGISKPTVLGLQYKKLIITSHSSVLQKRNKSKGSPALLQCHLHSFARSIIKPGHSPEGLGNADSKLQAAAAPATPPRCTGNNVQQNKMLFLRICWLVC